MLAVLGVGFLAGFGTDRFILGADDQPSPSPPPSTSAPASPTAADSAAAQDGPPDATGSPAPADPAPAGPQGARAYLARPADEGLPVEQERDVILVLGRAVCLAPPSQRADDGSAGDHVAARCTGALTSMNHVASR